MSNSSVNTIEAAPPQAQLVQMATGHWVSRIIFAAAKLNLADLLADGEKTADELAGPTRTHAPLLYRLMRVLADLGVLTESPAKRFALTSVGKALQSNAPGEDARPFSRSRATGGCRGSAS